MKTVTYRPNLGSLKTFIKNDEMTAVIQAATDLIAERARANAPVATGAYRDSLRVTVHQHPSRVAGHVGAFVNHGPTVEKSHHVLRRALG